MNSKELSEYIRIIGFSQIEAAEFLDVYLDTLKTWLYRTGVPKKKTEHIRFKLESHPNYIVYTRNKNNLGEANVIEILLENRELHQKNKGLTDENIMLKSKLEKCEKDLKDLKKYQPSVSVQKVAEPTTKLEK